MRQLILVLILCGITSCSLFESKDKKTQKMVEQELQQIDWSDVDHYPLFSDCDETVSKALQKSCFEEKLVRHLTDDLKEFELTSETEIEDVVFLDFKIGGDGSIGIVNIENKEIFGLQMEKFEKKVAESLGRLPNIEPALKRGIPVSAVFRIPVLLDSK